ncbi:MAG: hypothetical protein WDN06_00915, partial [Asticcacaulis sp.]
MSVGACRGKTCGHKLSANTATAAVAIHLAGFCRPAQNTAASRSAPLRAGDAENVDQVEQRAVRIGKADQAETEVHKSERR